LINPPPPPLEQLQSYTALWSSPSFRHKHVFCNGATEIVRVDLLPIALSFFDPPPPLSREDEFVRGHGSCNLAPCPFSIIFSSPYPRLKPEHARSCGPFFLIWRQGLYPELLQASKLPAVPLWQRLQACRFIPLFCRFFFLLVPLRYHSLPLFAPFFEYILPPFGTVNLFP